MAACTAFASEGCSVIFKPTTTTIDIYTLTNQKGFSISSTTAGTIKILRIEDKNSDSKPDLLIGQATANSGNGGLYIIYGPNVCVSPCNTCTYADPNWCTTRESGFYRYQTTCYPGACPSRTYEMLPNLFICAGKKSNYILTNIL